MILSEDNIESLNLNQVPLPPPLSNKKKKKKLHEIVNFCMWRGVSWFESIEIHIRDTIELIAKEFGEAYIIHIV